MHSLAKNTITFCEEMAYKWQRFVLQGINEQYKFTMNSCLEIGYMDKCVDPEMDNSTMFTCGEIAYKMEMACEDENILRIG